MSSARPARTLSVLIVDDSEIVRDIVVALFEAGGHVAASAPAPQEVDAAKAAGVDVVLVDQSFPRPDVEVLVRSLRASNATAKIVVFSDKPDAVLTEAARALGADGWLRKSTGPRLVSEVVERFA